MTTQPTVAEQAKNLYARMSAPLTHPEAYDIVDTFIKINAVSPVINLTNIVCLRAFPVLFQGMQSLPEIPLKKKYTDLICQFGETILGIHLTLPREKALRLYQQLEPFLPDNAKLKHKMKKSAYNPQKKEDVFKCAANPYGILNRYHVNIHRDRQYEGG